MHLADHAYRKSTFAVDVTTVFIYTIFIMFRVNPLLLTIFVTLTPMILLYNYSYYQLMLINGELLYPYC